ncbi:MAG: hypothetical protein R3C32_01740 [Chloroflexota bacterium]
MGIVTSGPVESGNGVWLSGLLTFIVGVTRAGTALYGLQAVGPDVRPHHVRVLAHERGLLDVRDDRVALGPGPAILAGVLLWYLAREQTVAAFTGSDGKRI